MRAVQRDGGAPPIRVSANSMFRALVFYKLSQRHFTRGSKSSEDVTLVSSENSIRLDSLRAPE
jgi:hypothetical protein